MIGAFHTGIPELDRQLAEMPLGRFQRDFGLGDRATLIVLTGPSLVAVNAALPQIRALAAPDHLSVEDWGSLQPALREAITLDFSIGMLLYATLVAVVAFIILNTLLMSVLERTREFGTLLAIGMRPDLIGRMLWYELLLLSVLGVGLGIVIGGAAALWFEIHGIAVGHLEGLLAQWGLPGRLYPASARPACSRDRWPSLCRSSWGALFLICKSMACNRVLRWSPDDRPRLLAV